MRGPHCHESIAKRVQAYACPREILDTFGVVCHGEDIYFGKTPSVAELEEYGIVERPFMHLRMKSAESICELVVLGRNVDRYGKNMVG